MISKQFAITDPFPYWSVEVLCLSLQHIHFDDFKQALIVDDDEDKEEGQEEEEQVDTTPWAGSDRDYTYDEARGQ